MGEPPREGDAQGGRVLFELFRPLRDILQYQSRLPSCEPRDALEREREKDRESKRVKERESERARERESHTETVREMGRGKRQERQTP